MGYTYSTRLGKYIPGVNTTDWGEEINADIALTDSLTENLIDGNGVLTGGTLSAGAGATEITVAAGKAYINGTLREWAEAADEALTDDSMNYISISDAGAVTIDTSPPTGDFAFLGRVLCESGAREYIKNFPNLLNLARTAGVDLKLNADLGTDGTAADATLSVERGVTGVDANIKWNETTDRFQAGLAGSEQNILLNATAEDVTDWNSLVIGNSSKISVITASGFQPETQVLGTGWADSAMVVGRFSADAAGPGFAFVKSRNAAINGKTIVQDGDALGTIYWIADDGNDYAGSVVELVGRISGTPGANDTPGRLAVRITNDGAASPSDKFYFDPTGMIGVNGYDLSIAGYIDLVETSAPSGVADTARIWAQVGGDTKTDLWAIFQSGAAQAIVAEP